MKTIHAIFSSFMCCLGAPSPDDKQPINPDDTRSKHVSTTSTNINAPVLLRPNKPNHPEANHHLPSLDHYRKSLPDFHKRQKPSNRTPALQREPSFDINFKFGAKSPEATEVSRLGHLGSHIRQKISEGRLSKDHSKQKGGTDESTLPHKDNSKHSASIPLADLQSSQRSAGLAEFLMSRTGSETGYDSDAKSIRIAMVSTPDTAKGQDPAKRANSADEERRPSPAQTLQQTSASTQEELPRTNTPSPISFKTAILAEKDTSPMTALQKLSIGLASGVITLPDSPGPDVATKPLTKIKSSTSKSEEGASSVENTEFNVLGELRRLGDTAAVAKRESLRTNPDDARDSLVSNLDLSLLQYISRFTESETITKIEADPFRGPNSVASSKLFNTTRGVPPVNSNVKGTQKFLEQSLDPLDGSDQDSIHLFNMRISQNLASPSLLAVASRPTTSHTSTAQHPPGSLDNGSLHHQISKTTHAAQRSAVEHNRRPSDPLTRLMFEGELGREKSQTRRRTADSTTCRLSQSNPQTLPVVDDASSFYWSDGDVADSEDLTAYQRKRNPNSIAVGGRSESLSLPITTSTDKIQPARTEESAWFGRKRLDSDHSKPSSPTGSTRSRSLSLPEERTHCPVECTTEHNRRHRTEENERFSEINASVVQTNRKDLLTEQSAQTLKDAANERMSEVDAGTLRLEHSN